jgi:YVTN family beta-propeller protein
VAANPATNMIYVANWSAGTVTVIDGATNATTTFNVGNGPTAVAVNPETNTIYVANCGSGCGGSGDGSVTVINGATNATTTLSAGIAPSALAVNPLTDMVYVANQNSSNVTVIDGATNATTLVNGFPAHQFGQLGTYPYRLLIVTLHLGCARRNLH